MSTSYGSHSNDDWQAAIEEAQKRPKYDKTYPSAEPGSAAFAQYIDHTLLKLDATQVQIDKLCDEAKTHGFKSVCVRLPWVARASSNLQPSTSTVVACVVGFHEGTYATAAKVREAQAAVAAGAAELDMVLNHSDLKAKAYAAVYHDIASVRAAATSPTVLKVILETSQLSSDEIVAGCVLARAADADFVKTSTGFNGRGATVEDVRIMKHVVGESVKVKASGGVRSTEDALKMIEAGVERIGTSSGLAIMNRAASSAAY